MEKEKIAKVLNNNFKTHMAAVFTLLIGGLVVGAGDDFAFFVAGGGLGSLLLHTMDIVDLNGLYQKVK